MADAWLSRINFSVKAAIFIIHKLTNNLDFSISLYNIV